MKWSFSKAVFQRSGLSAKRSDNEMVIQQSGPIAKRLDNEMVIQQSGRITLNYQQINLYNYGRINSNSYPCFLGNVPCAFPYHQHHAESKRAQETQRNYSP